MRSLARPASGSACSIGLLVKEDVRADDFFHESSSYGDTTNPHEEPESAHGGGKDSTTARSGEADRSRRWCEACSTLNRQATWAGHSLHHWCRYETAARLSHRSHNLRHNAGAKKDVEHHDWEDCRLRLKRLKTMIHPLSKTE